MGDSSQSLIAWSYGIAAAAFLAFAVQLAFSWRGSVRGALVLCAIILSVFWTGCGFGFALSASPTFWIAASLFDVARIAAWLALLLSLLYVPRASDQSRESSLSALRRGKATIPVVGFVVFALVVHAAAGFGGFPLLRQVGFGSSLLIAIVGLVLVEQLFRNIPSHALWGIKSLCLGLGSVFAFDIYLYADAFLFKDIDPDVWGVRGVINALIIPFVAVSVARNRDWTLDISVSRQVVFHSATMLASGAYLLIVAAAGYYVRYFGGTWGRALQTAFLFAGLLAFGLLVFSGTLRSRLRVFLNKNFFSYRYDYRAEWLKFTRSLSAQDPQLDIRQVSIKALADLVESPGGGLWLRDETGRFTSVSRWNFPEAGESEPDASPFIRFLAQSGWVIDVGEYQATPELYKGLELPSWLSDSSTAWLVVPLLTVDELMGFVVLAMPRARIDVNWEVLDLLKTGGRQAASFLGQMKAAEELLESKKLDAFNRMSAFVVHDIKNLVAQLALLLKNAERHKNNPEFQDDMLATVSHVVERMKQLLMQLRAGTEPVDKPRAVELEPLIRRIVSSKATQKPAVSISAEKDITALCHADRIERVMGHLVQNALDASRPDGRVWIILGREGGHAVVEVGDNGHGMTQEFIRERLFKPFQTTKQAGMGIGAYESHRYVSELGGKILVDSQPNKGTRVTLLLPLPGGLRTDQEKREVA